MSGLLIDGKLHTVPGVNVLAPGDLPWVKLVRGVTRTTKPQFKILHKTSAEGPEIIIDTVGPIANYGGAEDTIRYWQTRRDKDGNPNPASGTHLVTGHNGFTVCTADLVRFIGWHCHTANDRSWGHEIKEYGDGRVHRSALEAAAAVTLYDTSALGVQWQCPSRYVRNAPMARLVGGGRDMVGVFGHRDCTDRRGCHDPGDLVFKMLEASGFERFDFYAGQDLDVWGKRQRWLNERHGAELAEDGMPGARTTAVLKTLGFPGGIWARWRECAERPPMPDA